MGAAAGSKPQQPKIPFERTLLIELKRDLDGAERFSLPDPALPRLAKVLAQDLNSRDAKAALTRVLQLAAAFDGTLNSPSVAVKLRALLRAEPAAIAMLRSKVFNTRSFDALRAFQKSEARDAKLRAPAFGEKAPEKTVPLRSFLDPVGPPRPRSQRGTARNFGKES